MAMNTLASTNPRTSAIAGTAGKHKIAPHMLPNRAGQLGKHAKAGIVNAAIQLPKKV